MSWMRHENVACPAGPGAGRIAHGSGVWQRPEITDWIEWRPLSVRNGRRTLTPKHAAPELPPYAGAPGSVRMTMQGGMR